MTPTDFDKMASDVGRRILDQIDDYKDTIFAILGFSSLWFFDREKRSYRTDIKIFQGRHLFPTSGSQDKVGSDDSGYVCPDLGIVIREECGLLGEVKKNFPRNDEQRQSGIFEQLRSYDQDLKGWPTNSKLLPCHDIILMVHQATARYAQEYYTDIVKIGQPAFHRQFAVVQFNRSDQRVPYFFFQVVTGKIDCGKQDLDHGIQVPMQVLLDLYSKSKIYDAEPPLAYLAHLIWEHVVTPIASESSKFATLHRNQKIEVDVELDVITEKLCEGFSFQCWHKDHPDNQPMIPHKQ